MYLSDAYHMGMIGLLFFDGAGCGQRQGEYVVGLSVPQRNLTFMVMSKITCTQYLILYTALSL